jgi:hypothetical protein
MDTKLHALGLPTGSLPDETTEQLRTYCRQRTNWIDIARATHKMQKYLGFFKFPVGCCSKRYLRTLQG